MARVKRFPGERQHGSTNFKITGLDSAIRTLGSIPNASTRAARNAINVTLTETKREVVDIVKRELGIKKSLSNRLIILERPKFVGGRVVLEGFLTARNSRIRLFEYKTRIVKRSPTRATVYVKDEVGQPERLSGSAFVNPRYQRNTPYRRTIKAGKRVGRGPIVLASGPSMAIHLRAIMTPAYMKKRADRFQVLYGLKFEEQLAKIRF